MLRARGIDLVLDETFAKFVECHIQKFRLKFSEMSGGGLVARFSASLPVPLEMLSKRGVAVSGPLPRAPISPGEAWEPAFSRKASDCDVGDALLISDLAGRAFPYQCEEFLSRQVASCHRRTSKQLSACDVCLATDGSTPLEQIVERLGVIEKETVLHHPGVVFFEGFPSLADRRQHQVAVYRRLVVNWRSIGGFLREERRLMRGDGGC